MRNRSFIRSAMYMWCSVLLGPGTSDEEMHGAQRTLQSNEIMNGARSSQHFTAFMSDLYIMSSGDRRCWRSCPPVLPWGVVALALLARTAHSIHIHTNHQETLIEHLSLRCCLLPPKGCPQNRPGPVAPFLLARLGPDTVPARNRLQYIPYMRNLTVCLGATRRVVVLREARRSDPPDWDPHLQREPD